METLSTDMLVYLALELDLPTLVNYCRTSKKINRLTCDNYSFWYNKLYRDFGYNYTGKRSVEYIKDFYKRIANSNMLFKIEWLANIGNVELVRKLIDEAEWKDFSDRFYYAAYTGDKKLIDNLIQEGDDYWYQGLFGAARGGHKDLVDFFIEKGATNWGVALESAAKGGHKDLVDFFIEKGATNWHRGLTGAANGGHQDLIDFFIDKGAKNWNDGMQNAAQGGHRDIVNFFIEKGATNWHRGLEDAAYGGYKDLIDFFYGKRCN